MDQRQAQKRVAAIAGFRDELRRLVDLGLVKIGTEERRGIEAYHDEVLADLATLYDVDTSGAQARLSWGMRIASTFGAIALSIAVLLAFDYFWQSLATPVQVAVASLAPLVLIGLCEGLRAAGRNRYFIGVGALIAAAAFGLNLWVLGRVFNLPFDLHALAAFGLFTAALGHRHASPVVLAAGLGAVMVYVSGQLATLDGRLFVEAFWERQDLLALAAAAVLLAGVTERVAVTPELRPAYRVTGIVGLGYALITLSFGGTSLLPLNETTVAGLYQITGFVVAGLLLWLGLARDWPGTVYTAYGFLLLFTLVRLYDWAWDAVPDFVFFLILGVVALVLLWVLKTLREVEQARDGRERGA